MLVTKRYQMPDAIKAELKSMKPVFGYGLFSEVSLYRTYARAKPDGSVEDWADIVIRCIEGCLSIRKDWYLKNYISWDEDHWDVYGRNMALSMFNMNWMPAGRGLWAMGTDFIYERGSMALNNCFSGDTRFINHGMALTLKEMVDENVEVETASGPQRATVKSFGEQDLYSIMFKPFGTRSNHKLTYKTTRNHRWILKDGSETTHLKERDLVQIKPGNVPTGSAEYTKGFCHGLIFADGCNFYKDKYNIRLCGWKEAYRDLLENDKNYTHTIDTHDMMVFESPINLKKVPEYQLLEYKQGFIDGWKLFDGHEKTTGRTRLDTIDEEAVEWVKNHSGLLNYIVVGHTEENNTTNFGPRNKPLQRLTLAYDPVDFVVSGITNLNKKEEVFCVVEPKTRSFMLAGGLITGNCGFVVLGPNLGADIHWAMDALMCGVGIGFRPDRTNEIVVQYPKTTKAYQIPDTREGWVDSVKLLIDSYTMGSPRPEFDYSIIRPEGVPIKGFGGTASGPAPLKKLHEDIVGFFERFSLEPGYDELRLKCDIANAVGCCVVAGNVRRSAEILCGSIHDEVFMNLKNYEKYPEREAIGWMSNNSVYLETSEDYEYLGSIAEGLIRNGEPGIINLQNLPTGRVGKKNKGLRRDKAAGFNPCGEIPLESFELCNLVETLPTKCKTPEQWYKACEYATLYACSVSLLPTHRPETNAVVARNRRIGVGIIDYTGWVHEASLNQVIKHLRKGYKLVRQAAHWANSEAGVPDPIRHTTIKPGGTTPKVAGKTAGMGFPNAHNMLRRIRIAHTSPIYGLLCEANIPHEPDLYSTGTEVFEFPIKLGPSKPAMEASLREQAWNLVVLQREWADNAVSNTLNFKPKWVKKYTVSKENLAHLQEVSQTIGRNISAIMEGRQVYEDQQFKLAKKYGNIEVFAFNPKHEEDDIESVLASIAPHIKSVSLLPQTEEGVYKQIPEQTITEAEYFRRLKEIKPIDWSKLKTEISAPEVYCTSEVCELPK